jgi:hypothetical protein
MKIVILNCMCIMLKIRFLEKRSFVFLYQDHIFFLDDLKDTRCKRLRFIDLHHFLTWRRTVKMTKADKTMDTEWPWASKGVRQHDGWSD